jgi:hypothetical protein
MPLPPCEDDNRVESAKEAANNLGEAILFGEPLYASPLARRTVFGGYRTPSRRAASPEIVGGVASRRS